MSSEDQRTYKRSTGTVPKQRNSYSRSCTEAESIRSLSNSSIDHYYEHPNPRRSNQIMECSLETNGPSPIQNRCVNLNIVGSSNSRSTSRKNSSSSILKCDNITKHPNKKQIEDKLNQIHEYLKVTNSLMASINKTDNQISVPNEEIMIESDLPYTKNDGSSAFNMHSMKENDRPSFQFKCKSENTRLSPAQNRNLLEEFPESNQINDTSNRIHMNYTQYNRSCNEPVRKNTKLQHNMHLIPTHDKTVLKTESLYNLNIGDNGEQLNESSDFGETELTAQHIELHKKLIELQNRKFQIDQFVAQIQNSVDNEEEMENQLIKIGAMKGQLEKLKEMLDIVKMPQNSESTNNQSDHGRTNCFLCSTTDSFGEKTKSQIINYGNTFQSSSTRPKQLNNNSSKTNLSNVVQKATLQTELECKKRELVEIMAKHKVNPSNLNQGLSMDMKSDISFPMNGTNDPWASVISNGSDSDRFSSDGFQDDENEESKHNFISLPPLKYSASVANCQPDNFQRIDPDSGRVRRQSNNSPELHRGNNCAGSTQKKFTKSNSQDLQTHQVQKQLQMIRSMCDSMLEHPNTQENYSNIQQQAQNNQSHTSHRIPPSHPQHSSGSSGNGMNSEEADLQFPPNSNSNMAGYYNWFTTNTIQTQSFMLNALNQCYQMIWMQQKELVHLKNQLSTHQEKIRNSNAEGANNKFPSPPFHTNSQSIPNIHLRPPNEEHKMNQDIYGIPITNHFEYPLPVPFNCINNTNSQLVEPCLNDMELNHPNIHQNTEHVIPSAMNHSLREQIWPGQALNNQVVPGNRANNYWDNFRSYSRQNLLSTKNSEVLPNLPPVIDRPNFINQCSNPFTFMSFSKSNSEQDSNSTQDLRMSFKATNPSANFDALSRDSRSDVAKTEESEPTIKHKFHKDNNDAQFGLPSSPNSRTGYEQCFNNSANSERNGPKLSRRVQEMNKTITEEVPGSKFTLEEIKENIYKEVSVLITANENRPQFLIQLFRDLQLIQSDNARDNVSHTIEKSVHSPQNSKMERINTSKTHLPTDINAPSYLLTINDYATYKNFFQETQVFLERNEEIRIKHDFLISLKEFLSSSESLRNIFKDSSLRNGFLNLLENDLHRYFGQKLGNIKMQILQRINDLICEQRGMIDFREEIHCKNNDVISVDGSANNGKLLKFAPEIGQTATNRELAEADQSRVVTEDFVEEGAVGGITDESRVKTIDETQISDQTTACPPNQSRSQVFDKESQGAGTDREQTEMENCADLFLTR